MNKRQAKKKCRREFLKTHFSWKPTSKEKKYVLAVYKKVEHNLDSDKSIMEMLREV